VTADGQRFEFGFPVVLLVVPETTEVELNTLNDRWTFLPAFAGESEAEEYREKIRMPVREKPNLDRRQFLKGFAADSRIGDLHRRIRPTSVLDRGARRSQ
jgi:hypothetical protein